MRTEIIIFPRGQLSPKDKERLTKHGILAIEADDPSTVRRLNLEPVLNLSQSLVTGDGIIASALKAIASQPPANANDRITYAGRAAHCFVEELAILTKARP